jgi:HlyD family secretion protein
MSQIFKLPKETEPDLNDEVSSAHSGQKDFSGAGMDVRIERRSRLSWSVVGGAAALLAIIAWAWVLLKPNGLAVPRTSLRIAMVERGTFNEDVAIRATVDPLHSVVLDSIETGRVEDVYATDGQIVKRGDPLFRLSNPQRQIDLLVRQSDEAQRLSYTLNLRVSLETGRLEHQRRLAELQFERDLAEKTYARIMQLAEGGAIPRVQVQDTKAKLEQDNLLLEQEKTAGQADLDARQDSLKRMEKSFVDQKPGLKIVRDALDALTVRAPVDGRLTDFHLEVGASMKADDHIGRIDDPSQFRLSAQIDEFYRGRVVVARAVTVDVDGHSYSAKVSRTYSQITDGKFSVEMVFDGEQPGNLSPGLGVNAKILLGEPSEALLLPNGTFFNDTSGEWVYLIASDGRTAQRHEVNFGRRSSAQLEVLSGLGAGDRVIVSAYADYGGNTRLQLK